MVTTSQFLNLNYINFSVSECSSSEALTVRYGLVWLPRGLLYSSQLLSMSSSVVFGAKPFLVERSNFTVGGSEEAS